MRVIPVSQGLDELPALEQHKAMSPYILGLIVVCVFWALIFLLVGLTYLIVIH